MTDEEITALIEQLHQKLMEHGAGSVITLATFQRGETTRKVNCMHGNVYANIAVMAEQLDILKEETLIYVRRESES